MLLLCNHCQLLRSGDSSELRGIDEAERQMEYQDGAIGYQVGRTDLRSFLGSIDFFPKFIESYASKERACDVLKAKNEISLGGGIAYYGF